MAEEKLSSLECMKMEAEYGAHNYHPVPVVIDKGEGAVVHDPEGKRYYDFLSAYSAVNQGHIHPKIRQTLIDQSAKMCLTSRAFYNNVYPKYTRKITQLFQYDMVLPMNTGAEAVETALKLARSWGYQKKKIPEDQAIVLSVAGNFHGRTISIVGMSTDPDARNHFGPFTPGLGPFYEINGEKKVLQYNDAAQLEEVLEAYGDRVCAFLVEPIQGEAGVFVPDDGYIKKCYDLCKKHNVLFIDDEIQTGLCRTGKMLCVEHYGVRPDVVLLGKALSGGFYPVSAVLADKDVMLCIKPGEHGSTYGGNPLGCAIATTALDVLVEEKLAERAAELGNYLMKELVKLKEEFSFVNTVRGKGLLCAIVVDKEKLGKSAWQCTLLMEERGLLCKPTHEDIIRLAPPLVITKEQLEECVAIVRGVLKDIQTMDAKDIPRSDL